MKRRYRICLLGMFLSFAFMGCSAVESAGPVKQISKNMTADPDKRIIVSLSPDQRQHVLDEMNQFLLSVQEVVEGLATDDSELVQNAVSDSARQMQGRGQNQGLMAGALPPEFRKMGAAMRAEFGKIEGLSKSGATHTEILDQLSTTMTYCQSCHMTYQIRLAE